MILCLLVTCKVFTQSVTKTNYVFLTEDQARANIKELIAFDALKLISAKQEERIKNFEATIIKYNQVIEKKDDVISYKDSIIDVQDKIINNRKPLEFHSYGGIRSYNFSVSNPIFYYRVQMELKKVNIGAMANYQPVVPNSQIDEFNFNIYVEYKFF